nr:MAG TPA: hypothetical protein [Caudoviricetes sp.]
MHSSIILGLTISSTQSNEYPYVARFNKRYSCIPAHSWNRFTE